MTHPSPGSGTFDASELQIWVAAIFRGCGLPDRSAEIVADCLLAADLRGVASHGVSRIPIYLKRLRHGLLDPAASPIVVTETASTLLMDARAGFGHPAMIEGLTQALVKARETGICALGLSNSTHFGMAGYYADYVAREGMIGIVTSNSAARMAPWGARDALFGTNPIAIGIPAKDGTIVLDMATSAAALGRIMTAQALGQEIPPGWALDSAGNPTTDATSALDGTLLPVGGAKGSGLAFMLDILAGILTRGSFGRHVNSIYRQFEKPERAGHFAIVINVGAFMPLSAFKEAVAFYAADIKACRPSQPGQEVLLAGEIEERRAREARLNGIQLPEPIVSQLTAIAVEMAIELPRRVGLHL